VAAPRHVLSAALKSGWQVALQWALVMPHQPYCEQHWPLGQRALAADPQAPPR
jgi:hypothetical protein